MAKSAKKLFSAISKGDPDTVEFLLQANGDPNRKRKNGQLPLEVALFKFENDCVEKLLEGNADPNVILERKGRTPLHFCLKDDDENVQAALSLVRHGAHPHFEFCGKTPFQIAAERNIHALIEAILALPEKYDHFHSKNFFPRDLAFGKGLRLLQEAGSMCSDCEFTRISTNLSLLFYSRRTIDHLFTREKAPLGKTVRKLRNNQINLGDFPLIEVWQREEGGFWVKNNKILWIHKRFCDPNSSINVLFRQEDSPSFDVEGVDVELIT